MSAWVLSAWEWSYRNWIAILTALAMIGIGVTWRGRRSRPYDVNKWQPWVVAVLASAVLLYTWQETRLPRWQVLVATLPLLVILYHAFNLWREAPSATAGMPTPDGSDSDMNQESMLRVKRSIDAYYSADSIVARYALPALLIPIVGLWEFYFVEALGTGAKFAVVQPLWPLAYGLVGAYIFVFLELGKRGVRNDITPVSILWCLTTLVIGPVLAALIPTIFNAQPPAGTPPTWGERSLWIFAGYSPRVVFRAMERGVRKLLQEEEPVVQDDRRIPLGRVRGVGVEEAERLAQEGIGDVHALACVDPVRLMRDTRFDNWRILSWVDQALLISWVQEDVWRELVKRGYQGATDVAELLSDRKVNDDILADIAKVTGTVAPALKDELARLVDDMRTRSFRVLAKYVLTNAVGNVHRGKQHPAPSAEAAQAPPSTPSGHVAGA